MQTRVFEKLYRIQFAAKGFRKVDKGNSSMSVGRHLSEINFMHHVSIYLVMTDDHILILEFQETKVPNHKLFLVTFNFQIRYLKMQLSLHRTI